MPLTYAFWNNKGGTGKTSIAFQTIALYAEKHPSAFSRSTFAPRPTCRS